MAAGEELAVWQGGLAGWGRVCKVAAFHVLVFVDELHKSLFDKGVE